METDERFIDEHRALVTSCAKKLKAQLDLTIELDELVAAGFEGLVDARSRFDPTRGVQFKTFAYYRIRGAIVDAIRRQAYLPRRAHAKLKAAEAADLVSEGVGEQRAQAREVRSDALAALDDAVGKITAAFVMSVVGQGEDDAPVDPEEALASAQQRSAVRTLLDQLPDRERALITGFYFEGRRFDEVAEELGISKSWASRLHTKALLALREALGREL